jgi:hypothetical protein
MTEEEKVVLAQIAHRLFTSDDGRRWMEFERVNYGEVRSFVEGFSDSTAFREGRRDTYLEKLEWIALGKDPGARALTIVTQDDTPEAA